MKKFLSLSAVLIVSAFVVKPAFAMSTYVPVMNCVDASDRAVQVQVSQYEGPLTLGVSSPADYNVNIVQGSELVARFQGVSLARVQPGIFGAGANYVAQGLDLYVGIDQGPNREGIPSTLTAEINGQRVVLSLFCNYVETLQNTGL